MNGLNYAIGAYVVGLGLMVGYAAWLWLVSKALTKRENRQRRHERQSVS